jgi:hypothetical protein
MTFLNFTQHKLQPLQMQQGCEELPSKYQEAVRTYLTLDVDDAETLEDSIQAAKFDIASVAERLKAIKVLIGGHPGLMVSLAKELKRRGIEPVMAHSDRVSVDMPDGTKRATFTHKFFYPV